MPTALAWLATSSAASAQLSGVHRRAFVQETGEPAAAGVLMRDRLQPRPIDLAIGGGGARGVGAWGWAVAWSRHARGLAKVRGIC